jgi:hypothetical protein
MQPIEHGMINAALYFHERIHHRISFNTPGFTIPRWQRGKTY